MYISRKQESEIRKIVRGSWAGENEFSGESTGSQDRLVRCYSGSTIDFQDANRQILFLLSTVSFSPAVHAE